MCKFGSQVSRHSPWKGLPQLALWHHVGVTIGITLDKNGSLYDPAGTESWNMQIRCEIMKLTMHPTNNRSSPEKIIYRRRSVDKIIQIHRRYGFGEIIQKKSKILSATRFRRKYWGRFWCSWTNRKWPKLIPDCDNSAVKWNFTWNDVEVLGLSLFPFRKKLAGTSRWSAVISQALDRCLRWHLTYPCSRCPLQSRSFTSVQMIHTHNNHKSM